MEDFKPFPNFSTDVLHEGQEPEQWNSRAVVPPISTATTFKQFAPAEHNVSLILYYYIASLHNSLSE